MSSMQDRLNELDNFLKEQGIKHFRAYELVTGLDRDNTVPDKSLWPNIIPVLKVLDRARDKIGAAIKPTCAYRNDIFNAKVKGRKNSQHKQFKAIDCRPANRNLMLIEDFYDLLDELIPKDSWGLMLYDTFVHIDDRDWLFRDK